jgi:hypothetical protein
MAFSAATGNGHLEKYHVLVVVAMCTITKIWKFINTKNQFLLAALVNALLFLIRVGILIMAFYPDAGLFDEDSGESVQRCHSTKNTIEYRSSKLYFNDESRRDAHKLIHRRRGRGYGRADPSRKSTR